MARPSVTAYEARATLIPMAAITLRDIPSELRNRYKAVLAEQGRNMKQDLVEYMQRVVDESKRSTSTHEADK